MMSFMQSAMPDDGKARSRVRIGGAAIDAMSLPRLLRRFDQMIGAGASQYVCFCESHLCVRATCDREVRAALDGASLVLPDGVSLMIGARFLGQRLPQRLPGPVVMLELCSYGVPKGYRHFFYCGAEGVPEKLAERLCGLMPGLIVAGTYSPPFRSLTDAEEEHVKRLIEESRADVLWVGLGAPKQERWMAQHVGRIGVPVMLGVGAAFDFHSGARKWAPHWVRKAGLEWLFSMFAGGRRIFVRTLRYDMWVLPIIVREVGRQVLRFRRDPGSLHGRE